MSNEVDILPHPSLGLDECQRIFESRLRKLVSMFIHHSRIIINYFLQLDFATSKGLRVPRDLLPSGFLTQGIRGALWTGLESMADVDQNSMLVCPMSARPLLEPAKVPIFVVQRVIPRDSNDELIPNTLFRHASGIESSTSVPRSASNGDHKKIHKIDKIKKKLVEMLRE